MKQKALEKIISELNDLPESKMTSLIDYIQYLKWDDDSFSDEETGIINQSRNEAANNEGTNWRVIRDDL